MNFFASDKLNALQAKEKAQWIAFAPVIFQATRVLRDTGILDALSKAGDKGLTQQEVEQTVTISSYGARVLLEASLGIGLAYLNDGRYVATKTTFFILNDGLTRANLDFTHDVCYQGMFFLDESIKNQKPEGLKVFGQWPTIYEALSKLPPDVQKSWFGFDHFYSDGAFPDALPVVFQRKPKTLLDIGGNTGKWALKCFEYNPDVIVTIMDLPGQVGMARPKIDAAGFGDRIRFHECNILNESHPFPKGFDAIWMSQFLDCFSDDQIVSILKRCRGALNPNGLVYIQETFWDRQKYEASAFSLQQTSLYFTAMANGNSQMYHSENFIRFVNEAGFTVEDQKDQVGFSHTILICKPS